MAMFTAELSSEQSIQSKARAVLLASGAVLTLVACGEQSSRLSTPSAGEANNVGLACRGGVSPEFTSYLLEADIKDGAPSAEAAVDDLLKRGGRLVRLNLRLPVALVSRDAEEMSISIKHPDLDLGTQGQQAEFAVQSFGPGGWVVSGFAACPEVGAP